MLKNTNNIKTSRGFTIVELLIVIVVIAILAAISIVAYNGIQDRGKTSSGQSLASQVSKKAAAYQTIESAYPTYTQLTGNTGDGTAGNPAEAELDDPSAVVQATSAAGAGFGEAQADGGAAVGYFQCAGGANIFFWDYSDGALGTPLEIGAGC